MPTSAFPCIEHGSLYGLIANHGNHSVCEFRSFDSRLRCRRKMIGGRIRMKLMHVRGRVRAGSNTARSQGKKYDHRGCQEEVELTHAC